MIDRWGRVVAHHAVTVLLLGVVLTLAAGAYGAGVFDSLEQGGFDDASSETARELVAERELFGNRTVDVVAVYSDEDRVATDRGFRSAVQDVVEAVPADLVTQVVPYYAVGPDSGLVSTDGHHAQVLVSLAGESQDDFLSAYDELAPLLEADGLETGLTGSYAV